MSDLAAAFRAMDEPAVRQRAAALGAAIASENGVGSAMEFIEKRLAGR
ncbi:hypothetical protein [Devosia sp. LC5]|nr:hypothetical protein [Devosia sp. LC5]